MQEIDFFTVRVVMLTNYLYLTDDVRGSSARLFALVISLWQHSEHLALKSTIRTEQVGTSLFI